MNSIHQCKYTKIVQSYIRLQNYAKNLLKMQKDEKDLCIMTQNWITQKN